MSLHIHKTSGISAFRLLSHGKLGSEGFLALVTLLPNVLNMPHHLKCRIFMTEEAFHAAKCCGNMCPNSKVRRPQAGYNFGWISQVSQLHGRCSSLPRSSGSLAYKVHFEKHGVTYQWLSKFSRHRDLFKQITGLYCLGF